MSRVFNFVADQIVTPSTSSRSLRKYSPGLLRVQGSKIVEVTKISKQKLASLSKSYKRYKTIIPGLVDPHTHLVFAGDRAREWARRLAGEDYEKIAKEGGGIQTTVRATRAATQPELLSLAKSRLKQFLDFGVTSLEIKSGYGLELDAEIKILKAIQSLKKKSKIQIFSTFLGAHAVPPEFSNSKDYVRYLILSALPKLKGLAQFQDVFTERGYFGVKESIELLNAGRKFGLLPKVHAHEFGRTGGVEVAFRTKAVSADHLQYVNDLDIERMKSSRTVPVVLPATSFFLGAKKFAPSRKLWDAGLPLAIASDFNPGTNPSMNFPLAGTFAAVYEGLHLDEVLVAQTKHAALALACTDRGVLARGKRADFVALSASSFEEMYYHYGISLVEAVYIDGVKAQ